MFKSLPFLVVLLVIPGLAQSQTLKVNVVFSSRASTHGPSEWYSAGLAEAGAPGCMPTPDGTATHCMRETTADAVSSIGLMPLSGVDITVRMPDGSIVKAGCYNCVFLRPGTYQAKIDKHGMKLEYKTVGNPEYNKDGTLKNPGKVTMHWASFRFVGEHRL
jgi:hypothetical protein